MDILDDVKGERDSMDFAYVDQQIMPGRDEFFSTHKLKSNEPSISVEVEPVWPAEFYAPALQETDKASLEPLSQWQKLALSVVHQSLKDAAAGDYDALLWLIYEGRSWLRELGISPRIIDLWGQALH